MGSDPVGARVLSTESRPALASSQALTKWVLWAHYLGVKWLEREADHSLPSSAKVRNAFGLIKHKGKLFAHLFDTTFEINF
jgi:hypothetical protein